MISTAEFEQLFFEYQPRLVRFAVRFVDEETAEDMVQNCFLKLWEKRESMALTNAQALLFQMVHNECLNELKHRVVASTESLDALMEVEGSEQLYWQDFAPDADAQLIGNELEQQINEALTHLRLRHHRADPFGRTDSQFLRALRPTTAHAEIRRAAAVRLCSHVLFPHGHRAALSVRIGHAPRAHVQQSGIDLVRAGSLPAVVPPRRPL